MFMKIRTLSRGFISKRQQVVVGQDVHRKMYPMIIEQKTGGGAECDSVAVQSSSPRFPARSSSILTDDGCQR
ncbi:MAG: hypothetical protein Q4P24_16105, partial [Rhodobacterales bacterium]|nr:hypothetical protein [Rhodobacterales bacterium]